MPDFPPSRIRLRHARAIVVPLLLLAGAAAAPAISPGDRVRLADGLYARGMLDLALREYTAVLTNASASVTNLDAVLFRVGECHRLQGNRDVASFFYQRLIAEHPASAFVTRAEFRRAEIRLNAGQVGEAAADFRAMAAKPLPPEIAASVLFNLGFAEARLQRDADSAAAYRRVLAEFAASSVAPYARVGLGAVLLRKPGQEEEVLAVCRPAVESPPVPRVAAEALYLCGEAAFRKKDYAAAAGYFDRLAKEHPQDERVAEAALSAGWTYHHLARYDDALKLAAGRIASAPPDRIPGWLYLQANCLRQLKRVPEAQGVYRQLLAKYGDAPMAPDAAYESALLAFQTGDYATTTARFPVEVPPSNPNAGEILWMLAESYRQMTNLEVAARCYLRLAAEFPADARAPVAALQSGRLAQDRGAMEEASKTYRDLATRFPQSPAAPEALFASGFCRIALKQPAEASKDWKKVAVEFPAFGKRDEALFRLAQAAVELKSDGEARDALDRFFKDHPGSGHAADAHYLMAVLQERAGAFDVASYHYQQAVKKNPQGRLAAEIQLRRAAALQHQNKNDEAAEVLQALLAATNAPAIPVPLLDWLARWQLQGARPAEADAAATALAAAATNDAWRQIGWYLAGKSRQAAARWPAAREAYAKAAGLGASTREGIDATFRLGEAALALQDLDAAAQSFTRAAELAAADEFLALRARSYLGLGQVARAREKWEEAGRYFLSVGLLFDHPEITPESLWYAAEALGRQGRASERDKELAELKARYPSSPWAAKPLP